MARRQAAAAAQNGSLKSKEAWRVMAGQRTSRSGPWGSWRNLPGSTGHSKSIGMELQSTAKTPTSALSPTKGEESFIRSAPDGQVAELVTGRKQLPNDTITLDTFSENGEIPTGSSPAVTNNSIYI